MVTTIVESFTEEQGWVRGCRDSFAWFDGAKATDFQYTNMTGKPTEDDQDLTNLVGVVRHFLALNEWIATKVARPVVGHIERHARKRLAKEQQVPADSPWHIVILRAFETERERANTREHQQVEWKSRWFVRPHWRRLAADRLTWVHTYIKGPADKPLSTPKQTVFAAVR